MKHFIYCIHDVKAAAFLPPFILPTEPMAVRSFTDCINDNNHQFGKHPQDYTLFCLGTFDDEMAGIDLHNPKIPVGNGIEYVLNSEESTED